MSDSYTKLFSSITASTIVSEPLATRWLWVTMLAMADGSGDVHGSIPGLARIANISLADCEQALACFLAPDSYSRTKDNAGRRVEEIDGGWRLLNHAKYRAIRSAEERREYMREYMRNRRASETAADEACKQDCKQPLAQSTEVTPPAPAPTPKKEQKQKQKHPRAERAALIPMPPDFSISDRVREWAEAKGFDRLRDHLDSFRDTAVARAYVYADWDAAFMKAVREDWAKLRGSNANRTSSRKLSVVEQVEQAIAENARRRERDCIEGEIVSRAAG